MEEFQVTVWVMFYILVGGDLLKYHLTTTLGYRAELLSSTHRQSIWLPLYLSHPLPGWAGSSSCPEGTGISLGRPFVPVLSTVFSRFRTIGMSTKTWSCFSFFGWAVACGILISWWGIEPVLPAVETQSSNHWTIRESHTVFLKG